MAAIILPIRMPFLRIRCSPSSRSEGRISEGSASALIRGIKEKLLPLPDEVTVYTGHNDTTTIGTERRYNPVYEVDDPGKVKNQI